MYKGKVVWFNAAKGYGFLSRDDGGDEVFVHFSALAMDGYKRLNQNHLVTFDIVKGDKGPQAENVQVIGA